jgi:hypothetical protein
MGWGSGCADIFAIVIFLCTLFIHFFPVLCFRFTAQPFRACFFTAWGGAEAYGYGQR